MSDEEPPMNCYRSIAGALSLLATMSVVAGGCGESQSGPNAGSNSNWLKLCDEDTDCGDDTPCQCGACATQCEDDTDCSRWPGAICSSAGTPASLAACFEGDPVGICLPSCTPGGCSGSTPCVNGSCAPLRFPSTDVCQQLEERSAEERIREDELFSELSVLRAAGGVTCGDNPATSPAPELRFDARLWCAARLLAGDLSETRERSLIDSQGRNTLDRLELVGYVSSRWGESYAFAETAQTALAAMLMGEESCSQLTAGDLIGVGVGVSGNAAVITLGSE